MNYRKFKNPVLNSNYIFKNDEDGKKLKKFAKEMFIDEDLKRVGDYILWIHDQIATKMKLGWSNDEILNYLLWSAGVVGGNGKEQIEQFFNFHFNAYKDKL